MTRRRAVILVAAAAGTAYLLHLARILVDDIVTTSRALDNAGWADE